MRYRFFNIPAVDSEKAEDDLNRFVASHRIAAVEKMFVPDSIKSFWSVCVTYLDQTASVLSEKKKIDYREVLDEQSFALFAKLRNLRKDISEKESIPAYALFTNEQLADMVRLNVKSLNQMGEINGIGKGRLDKYGKDFLDVLNQSQGPETRHEGTDDETRASEP